MVQVRFLTFSENEGLLDAVVELVRRRGLTHEAFGTALGRIARTCTIQVGLPVHHSLTHCPDHSFCRSFTGAWLWFCL